jgi:pteridine reductase
MFAAARDRFGRLDVLVNSAARFDRQPFEAITVADWERSLAVNLRAPFLCAQHAAPLMRSSARPEGETALIVNISDLSGVYPWIGYTQHGVSKAGLLHLTKITARELAPHIRVNAIIPGPLLPPPGVSEDSAGWQAIIERVPLQRSGGVEPVADTVLYLAHSDFITGAAINLDAGEALIGPPRAGKG